MLFNVNNNIKRKLFNSYKKAAEDYQLRKEEDRRRRIEEERDYMENAEKREREEQNRNRRDKIRQINDERREYKKMLNNKAENHLLVSKNRDVVINDYGYYINPVKSHSVNYNNNNNNNNNYNNNNYRRMNLSQKERYMVRTEDQMGVFLSDGVNKRYNNFVNNFKRNRNMIYKQILDKQVDEKKKSDDKKIVNGHNYRYDNPLIKKQEDKFMVFREPFNDKRN